MPIRSRALAGSGVACLAALAIAGCGTTGSGSSSSSTAVTITGGTLSIYLSEPSNLHADAAVQDIVDAEQMAYAAQHSQVKDYKLVLQPVRARTLTDNSRTAIIDPSTVAYLGEIAPGASDGTVGITNALDILQVSPTDNALELTDRTPGVSGGPKSFFESWGTYGRTFARLVPSAALEAKAQVAEMKKLGVTRLDVADDGSYYGRALADAVGSGARAAGLTVENSVGGAANGYFYGAQSPRAGARFFNHVASVAPTAKLFGPSSLNSGTFSSALAASVHHLYVSIPGFMPKDLPAAGRSFVSAFRTAYGHAPNVEAIFGYEAMADLLGVLKREGRNANNRTDVVRAFLRQRNVSSVLGTYSLDGAGNTSLNAFVFARMSGGRLVPFTAAAQS